jgi:hypothetical protein
MEMIRRCQLARHLLDLDMYEGMLKILDAGVGSLVGSFLAAAGCLNIHLLGRSGRSESRLISALLSSGNNLSSITMARCDVSSAEEAAAAVGRSTAQSVIHAGEECGNWLQLAAGRISVVKCPAMIMALKQILGFRVSQMYNPFDRGHSAVSGLDNIWLASSSMFPRARPKAGFASPPI